MSDPVLESLALVRPSAERRAGLLAYVDGVPAAHDLILSAARSLSDRRARWRRTQTALINLLSYLHSSTPRSRLSEIACRLDCLTLWMPDSPERIQLIEAAILLGRAPDYSRILVLHGRVSPWSAPSY